MVKRVTPQRRGRSYYLATVGLAGALVSLPGSIASANEATAGAEKVLSETQRLKELALDHWIAREIRLQRIAQRLQIAGATFCRTEVAPILGVVAIDPSSWHKSLRKTARARFRGKKRIHVVDVMDGSAADNAGVRVGDVLLELNGRRVESPAQVYGHRQRVLPTTRLKLARGNERLTLELKSVPGCRFPASIRFQRAVNAFANGSFVYFTPQLMRFFKDDDNLALIVGHEIAHNIYWAGARRSGWSARRVEMRADYVGLYLAAIAGYELTGGVFAKFDSMTEIENYSKSPRHPRSPKRVVNERKTIEEI